MKTAHLLMLVKFVPIGSRYNGNSGANFGELEVI
jgi:hypothetical protein